MAEASNLSGSPSRSSGRPIISVVIPCYNHGEFLLEAIASVENCPEPVYEILVVNDCSTDPFTLTMLAYLKKHGYTVIDHEENQGLAAARNTGVSASQGAYYLPLDADNKIRPAYLLESLAIFEEYPEVGVVHGHAEFFGEKSGIWEVPEMALEKILIGNYIDACAAIRKQAWEDCGGYDPNIPDRLGYEDWDFWLSAATKGWQFAHLREVVFDYRVRAGSMVAGCNVPENRRKLMHYLYTKHFSLYTTHFADTIAEKDYWLLVERGRVEELERHLERSQTAAEQWQGKWQRTYEQLQATQTQALQLEAELARIQSQPEKSETIHALETQVSLLQKQSMELQHQLGRSRGELQAAQAREEQAVQDLARSQCQCTQLGETLAQCQASLQQYEVRLQQSEARAAQAEASAQQIPQFQATIQTLQEQLHQAQESLVAARAVISGMESSKFWQLRNAWFRLRKLVGLGDADRP